MGSKLEYWFLLTKIAVVVLDVMIEDGVVSWWILWHVGGGIVLQPTSSNPSIFQSPISNRVWILDFPFTKSPSQLPKIRPIANLLSSKLLYGGNWKTQKSPNCSKFSQFTQKSLNFQSRRQSPISKVKNYPT